MNTPTAYGPMRDDFTRWRAAPCDATALTANNNKR